MGGIFFIVSSQFLELCTIPGLHHGRKIVGTYRLLTNKRQETYAKVFRKLQHLTNIVVPHSIMIDFELRMIAALNKKYPLLPRKFVYFIFRKAYNGMPKKLGSLNVI